MRDDLPSGGVADAASVPAARLIFEPGLDEDGRLEMERLPEPGAQVFVILDERLKDGGALFFGAGFPVGGAKVVRAHRQLGDSAGRHDRSNKVLAGLGCFLVFQAGEKPRAG